MSARLCHCNCGKPVPSAGKGHHWLKFHPDCAEAKQAHQLEMTRARKRRYYQRNPYVPNGRPACRPCDPLVARAENDTYVLNTNCVVTECSCGKIGKFKRLLICSTCFKNETRTYTEADRESHRRWARRTA